MSYKSKFTIRKYLFRFIFLMIFKIVTTSADYTIRVWDFEGNLKKELKEHKRWVWDAAFSSDSAYLVSCSSDGTAKLWDISKGDSIKTYKGHQKACVCIALHDLPKSK